MSEIDIPDAREVGGDVLSGGQPSREQLRTARAQGYRTIVNLRPDGEFNDYDEAEAVREEGMHYVHIPVAGPGDLSPGNARKLDDALGGGDATPAMVHCGSGNRVGALMACRARHVHGQDKESALRLGEQAGLDPTTPLYGATSKALD
jgi:uncharacterized protein (TIGR01244 family)